MVGCLTVAAGILARSEGVSKGTGTNQRFVKNALKNAELPPDSFKYLFFFYFCHIYLKSIQIITQCVCFTVWAFIINICLLLKNLKTDNVQHTILNFIRECLYVFMNTRYISVIQLKISKHFSFLYTYHDSIKEEKENRDESMLL